MASKEVELGNSHALLGYILAQTFCKSVWQYPVKLKVCIYPMTQQCYSQVCTYKNSPTHAQENVYKNIHISTVYNSKNLEKRL